MRFSKGSLYIFFLLGSCIAPYEVSTIYHEQLVVQGMITDQPGPYLVKISKTMPISDQLDTTSWESGAIVTISDDQGATETLSEVTRGNYFTKTFQGVIGRSYQLQISTSSGYTYQSLKQKLLPVGDFTNLRYEFIQNEPAGEANAQPSSTNGFNIYLDSDIISEQEGRVWWRWTGTFEILTYPSKKVKAVSKGPMVVLVPDPPPCSGYYSDFGDLTQIGFQHIPKHGKAIQVGPTQPCTCCTCWVSQYNPKPLISELNSTKNGTISGVNVAFIETNIRTFYDKYYLEVEQLSLSQDMYTFWKNVALQEGNSSNLFQTPPPKTTGNILSMTNGAPTAIGYFAASSVKAHAIVLSRSAVPYALAQIDTMAISCTQAYKNSVNTKPPFW